MQNRLMTCLIILTLLLASACSTFTTREERDLQTAQVTLESFFTLLAYGAYEEAASVYGGSYEALVSQNPTVNPDDYEELWRNACQNNGYQCLEIRQVVSASRDEQGTYHFVVEFQQADGSLFVLGACCGASATEMPPQSQFEYTVRVQGGIFLVADLPVFVP